MGATDPLFLGIDVGTTHVKAALVTAAGHVVAQAQIAYPTQHVKSGWVEQNPEDWWRGTVGAVRQVMAQVDPDRVVCIGVSGQGCAVTLVNRAGKVLRPALIWMDSRSEAQSETLRHTCGDTILRINGKQPAPYNADPKLMWLAQYEPEIIDQAWRSLTSTAYLNARLTGETIMNKSDASILFAFDLHRETWSPELIAAFGIPEHLYPPVTDSHTIIGQVQMAAASELGLRPGTRVIAGGEDTSSAGLALGVGSAGEAFLSLGTAGTVYIASDSVPVHPDLLTFMHVIRGSWLIGGSMIAAGAALDWCRRLLPGDLSFEHLTDLARTSEAGSGGVVFLPYLGGELQPINDGNARGLFFGINFTTGTAQLVRAVMEGVAFAIAHNLSVARQIGISVHHIRAVGSPARNPFWCQIIADVTGCTVEVIPDNAGAPLGNALLCAFATGYIENPIATARHLGSESHIFHARPSLHTTYSELFEIYQSLYPALKAQFAQLHGFVQPSASSPNAMSYNQSAGDFQRTASGNDE